MSGAWPWAVLAGLGVYHGLNPAMGWLFAVALGLHRGSRAVVLQSLIPITLGHAAAVVLVAAFVAAVGMAVDFETVKSAAGVVLIAWALYHLLYGTRHRTRVGMQAGFAGLFLWSFLMAAAHGAGLMLVPALLPICLSPQSTDIGGLGAIPLTLLGVGIHTAAMLIAMGAVAWLVYAWVGVAFLRRGWINLDLLWTAALLATGAVLLAS
jgi:hypothetical protein